MESFDQKAHQIASGKSHTLILTVNGLVYGCGSNLEGQLGCTTEHTSSITPVLVEDISHIQMKYIAAGSFSASISKDQGSIYLWGSGTFGKFNTPHRVKKIEQKAVQVDIGNSFGMVLTEDRDIYTWGINDDG
jgi:alpha-tubulin suppressor-like RCC1 family protein